MDLNLKHNRVIITAGAAGIGLEIAKAYFREGATVEICDIDASAIAELKATQPGISTTLCNVTELTNVSDFINNAAKRMGGLDILINNAGIAGPTAKVEDVHPMQQPNGAPLDLPNHCLLSLGVMGSE